MWLPSLDRVWFILQGLQLNRGKLQYIFLTTIDIVLEAVKS